MKRTITLSLALVAALTGSAAAETAGSAFQSRVDDIAAGWHDAGLSVTVNGGLLERVRIDESLSYAFSVERDAHLTVVHVDSSGVATLVVPSPLSDGHVRAGDSLSISGLTAGAPVGDDVLYAIATPTPLDHAALGLAPLRDQFVRADRETAIRFADRLADRFVGRAGEVAIATRRMRVLGGEEVQYTVAQVVSQLTPTRFVERPRMAFHKVEFEFDSAELTQSAQDNLDVVGQALSADNLMGESFVLGGHTDHLGSADYNRELSQQRAASAKRYLIDRWSIDPQRITIRGYGEDRPLVDGDNDDARMMNRRVELEVIR